MSIKEGGEDGERGRSDGRLDKGDKLVVSEEGRGSCETGVLEEMAFVLVRGKFVVISSCMRVGLNVSSTSRRDDVSTGCRGEGDRAKPVTEDTNEAGVKEKGELSVTEGKGEARMVGCKVSEVEVREAIGVMESKRVGGTSDCIVEL